MEKCRQPLLRNMVLGLKYQAARHDSRQASRLLATTKLLTSSFQRRGNYTLQTAQA